MKTLDPAERRIQTMSAAMYAVFAIEFAARSAHQWDSGSFVGGMMYLAFATPWAYLAIKKISVLHASASPRSETTP